MLKPVIIATLLLGASLAAAQTANAPGQTRQHASIGPAAVPGDTREQKLAWMNARAKAADTNDDGKLTLEEWTTAGGKRAGFDALDHNKDAVLTRQEFRSNARMLKAFDDFVAAAPH